MRLRRLGGLGVTVLAVTAAAACGSSKTASPPVTTAVAAGGSTTTAGGGSASSNAASAPGVTKDSVTVGLETDLTGIASSTFADTAQGAQARFSQQNAQGGVDGRTLKLVVGDTTSTPLGAQTSAQILVSQKKVFGVIGVTALFFGGTTYLHQQGIPVTGSSLDGPEWYTEPNTNMFNIEGTTSPKYPEYTSEGLFWKAVGVNKISFVASNTPSSTRGINGSIASAKAAGISSCADATVPLGAVDFTGVALAIKNAGCGAAECSCVLSSSLALATALQDLSDNIPVLFAAGPAQQVFQSASTEKESTGNFFTAAINYSGSAYDSMVAALKQYDTSFSGGIPDLGIIDGWQAADLFIRGLQVAGQNPTRASFITNLRQVDGWNANGLKPAAAVFHPFAVAPAQSCVFYLKFTNNQFQTFPAAGKSFCGTVIPGGFASP